MAPAPVIPDKAVPSVPVRAVESPLPLPVTDTPAATAATTLLPPVPILLSPLSRCYAVASGSSHSPHSPGSDGQPSEGSCPWMANVLAMSNRFLGLYRASVVDNVDPQYSGRVRVAVPEVLGDGQSGWAMPCVPYLDPDLNLVTISAGGHGRLGDIRGRGSGLPGLDGLLLLGRRRPGAGPLTSTRPRRQNGTMMGDRPRGAGLRRGKT